MLTLYTPSKLPKEKEIIQVPWDEYFIDKKIAKYFDNTDIEIVENVEETSLFNSDTIQGKFSDMPIGIGQLSEGCKTLLCINHAIKTKMIGKIIFNITSCGGNGIAYLATVMAKDENIDACIEHGDLGWFNAPIKIGEKEFNNSISASTELINIQGEIA